MTDEALRPQALQLIHELRDAGIAVDYALTETKVGKQFQAASAAGARYALTIGPDEWSAGEVKLKNLSMGTEERVRLAEVARRIPRRRAA